MDVHAWFTGECLLVVLEENARSRWQVQKKRDDRKRGDKNTQHEKITCTSVWNSILIMCVQQLCGSDYLHVTMRMCGDSKLFTHVSLSLSLSVVSSFSKKMKAHTLLFQENILKKWGVRFVIRGSIVVLVKGNSINKMNHARVRRCKWHIRSV